MACRSKNKAEEAIREIQSDTPEADVEFVPYDASSLQDVYATATAFLKRKTPLDIILLNAGAIVGEPKASEDNLEWMFAINHLAHFALITGLLPAIRQASERGNVRIVVTASAGFNMHPDPVSLHIEDGELNVDESRFWWKGGMPMYGRSKSCNILFASELSRRIRDTTWGRSVNVNAAHPGEKLAITGDHWKRTLQD